MGNNALVSQVLDTSAGRAPDMTHALCSLGDGDMGAGITALWTAGKRRGLIQGASFTTVVFSLGVGVVLLNRHRRNLINEKEHETTETKLNPVSAVQNKIMRP